MVFAFPFVTLEIFIVTLRELYLTGRNIKLIMSRDSPIVFQFLISNF